jgi:hypothetical protein
LYDVVHNYQKKLSSKNKKKMLNLVGAEGLMALSLKMAVLWVVAPCSLVKFTDISEVLAASIIRAVTHLPDDGGKYL